MDIDIIPVINGLEARYLDGDTEALLEALNLCTCLEGSPMPDWVADAVSNALYHAILLKPSTVDQPIQPPDQ